MKHWPFLPLFIFFWFFSSNRRGQFQIQPFNNFFCYFSVFDAKRLIGRDFADQTVQRDMKHWPFDIIENGKKPKIQVEFKCEKKTFTPEEISSMVSFLKIQLIFFLTFPACFYIPIVFSNLNSNCSNLLDMRNLQKQV